MLMWQVRIGIDYEINLTLIIWPKAYERFKVNVWQDSPYSDPNKLWIEYGYDF